MPKLTQKAVDALRPGAEEYVVWDDEVAGFGVRVRPSGASGYILMYRHGGKKRKHTLGRVEAGFPVKEARERAAELLRGLRDGVDPQAEKVADRHAITVAELVDAYLAEGPALKPNKKASSWKTDRGVLGTHVKPLIGRRLARDLTEVDVANFQLAVAQGKSARDVKLGKRARSRVTGGKTIAGLTIAVLGAAFQFGIRTKRVAHNPTRGVERFKVQRRERYLSERELACINEALLEFERADERLSVMADAVRLLVFTGCRKSEILTLRWEWIDWRKSCIRLPDSKTGARVVPIGDTAVELLKRRWDESRALAPAIGHNSGCAREPRKRSPFVLPALKGDGHFVGLPHLWEKVRIRADAISRERATEAGEHPDDVASLATVRIHDLRHSFASFAIADGASLFMVGKVLGHKQARTTEIYAHLSDDPIRHVASRTSSRLAAAMRG
jgi:integrase